MRPAKTPRASRTGKAFLALSLGLLVLAAAAAASRSVAEVELRAGDLILAGRGGFAPKALPKHQNAPIDIFGAGKISTLSDELPPILQRIEAEFDRHGAVDTAGLSVCTRGKLEATTVVVARRVCGDAIVGKGVGHGIVKFPEQAQIPVTSPLTLFNGPKKGGLDTVIGHGYLDIPVPTTYVVPVVIESIDNGVYGYRVDVKLPPIAGGHGIPISAKGKVGRKWIHKGVEHSFLNARCETGRLQARGIFSFNDDTVLSGSVVLPCNVRD